MSLDQMQAEEAPVSVNQMSREVIVDASSNLATIRDACQFANSLARANGSEGLSSGIVRISSGGFEVS